MSRLIALLEAQRGHQLAEAQRLEREALHQPSQLLREAKNNAAYDRRSMAEGVRISLEIVQAELHREREEAILMTSRALGWSVQETRDLFDRQSPAQTLADAAKDGP